MTWSDWFGRGAADCELDAELRDHIERLATDHIARGIDPAEARRRARLEFGGLDQMKDACRDQRGWAFLNGAGQDIRLACRGLRATPIVTAVALLSLSLGIGANTAIFSLVNSLLLRPLPVVEPQRLAFISSPRAISLGPLAPSTAAWSYSVWQQIQQRPELFDAAAGWTTERLNLARGGESQFVEGIWASGSFFRTLGVPAVLGRTFTEADDRRGGGPDGAVAVVSYRFWQGQLGGSADVIGRRVTVESVPFTIIGVTPRDFFGPDVGRSFDVALPLGEEPLVRGRDSKLDRLFLGVNVIVRLMATQTLASADAALRAVQPQIREATLPPLPKPELDR